MAVSTNGSWKITERFNMKYTRLFHSLDAGIRRRYITGKQAYYAFKMFDLPESLMAKIWKLADYDSNNELTCDEFIVAMFLCDLAKNGGKIPNKLPTNFVPEIFRNIKKGNDVLFYCEEQRNMGIVSEYSEWVHKNVTQDLFKEKKLCTSCFRLIPATNMSRHLKTICNQSSRVESRLSMSIPCRYCERAGQKTKRTDNMTIHLLHIHKIKDPLDIHIDVNVKGVSTIDETAKRNQGESSSHSKQDELNLLDVNDQYKEEEHQTDMLEFENDLQQNFDNQMREANENVIVKAEIEDLKKRFEVTSKETEKKHRDEMVELEKKLQQKFNDQLNKAIEKHNTEIESKHKRRRREAEKKHRDEIKKLDKTYSEKRRNYRKINDALKEEKDKLCQEHKNNITNLMDTLDRANNEKLKNLDINHKADIAKLNENLEAISNEKISQETKMVKLCNLFFDMITNVNDKANATKLLLTIAEMMHSNKDIIFKCHKIIAEMKFGDELCQLKNLIQALKIKNDDFLRNMFEQLKAKIKQTIPGAKAQDDHMFYGYCWLALGLPETATNSEIESVQEETESCHNMPKRRKLTKNAPAPTNELFTGEEIRMAASKLLKERRKKKL